MSYGTLRWLGILVALYQGSMRGGSPVTLVGIEEPETAVHPGAATALLEAMDEASLTTQVLATTHSAAMLDHEDLDIDIVRAVARVDGRTVIGPVDAASRQMLDESLTTAGELLRIRHLTPDEPADDRTTGLPAGAPA
jgi:predicted ATPase